MTNPAQTIQINKDELSDYKWITQEEVTTYFMDNDDEGVAVKKGFEQLKRDNNSHSTAVSNT